MALGAGALGHQECLEPWGNASLKQPCGSALLKMCPFNIGPWACWHLRAPTACHLILQLPMAHHSLAAPILIQTKNQHKGLASLEGVMETW